MKSVRPGCVAGVCARWKLVVLCGAMLLVGQGCSRQFESEVSGTVTLDGNPLRTGTLTLQPVAGGPLVASGISEDGTYRIKTGSSTGLPAGEYLVTVQAFSEIPSPGMNDKQLAAISLIPLSYRSKATSGLRVTVEPGANVIPIELGSE